MGKKKGILWLCCMWHHGAAGWVACSVWELTAGGGARLCQSSFPQKSGHCTSERHLFVPAKCALCAGSLSGGHDLGFG